MRKQRNHGGHQGMIYSPYAVMDIFAIGEVVVGSEKNISEKYATKLLYRQLMTPTTFDANSRIVALINLLV